MSYYFTAEAQSEQRQRRERRLSLGNLSVRSLKFGGGQKAAPSFSTMITSDTRDDPNWTTKMSTV
jgi:hypothetical protein